MEAFAKLYKDIAQNCSVAATKLVPIFLSARQARECLIMLEAIDRSAQETCWVAIDKDIGKATEIIFQDIQIAPTTTDLLE